MAHQSLRHIVILDLTCHIKGNHRIAMEHQREQKSAFFLRDVAYCGIIEEDYLFSYKR